MIESKELYRSYQSQCFPDPLYAEPGEVTCLVMSVFETDHFCYVNCLLEDGQEAARTTYTQENWPLSEDPEEGRVYEVELVGGEEIYPPLHVHLACKEVSGQQYKVECKRLGEVDFYLYEKALYPETTKDDSKLHLLAENESEFYRVSIWPDDYFWRRKYMQGLCQYMLSYRDHVPGKAKRTSTRSYFDCVPYEQFKRAWRFTNKFFPESEREGETIEHVKSDNSSWKWEDRL